MEGMSPGPSAHLTTAHTTYSTFHTEYNVLRTYCTVVGSRFRPAGKLGGVCTEYSVDGPACRSICAKLRNRIWANDASKHPMNLDENTTAHTVLYIQATEMTGAC